MLVEKMATLSNPGRHATSASLIVIAAFAMYNWTVKPHAVSLSSAKAYESIADEDTKENRIVAAKVETRRKMLQRLSEQSTQLLDTLFTSGQAGEFFADLEAISMGANCSVNSINLIDNKQKPAHERLGIRTRSAELSVVGSYNDVVGLITRLLGQNQSVWLDALEMRSIHYSSDKVGCKLTITICEIMDKDIS